MQPRFNGCAVLAGLLFAASGMAVAKDFVSYVAWKDPLEGAFTMEVPSGWRITGGMYQFAPVDVRIQVNAGSPDGAMYVQLGDATLATFAVPGPSSQRRGLHEGQSYEVNGVTYTVLHSMSGAEFSRLYVQSKLAKTLGGLKLGETRDRPDIAQALGQPLQNGATLGATEFTFTRGGRATSGICFSRVEPQGRGLGAIWQGNPSVVLAPPGQIQTVTGVLTHMVSHVKGDPEWNTRMAKVAKQFADRILTDHDATMKEMHAQYLKCINRIHDTAALWEPVLNPR